MEIRVEDSTGAGVPGLEIVLLGQPEPFRNSQLILGSRQPVQLRTATTDPNGMVVWEHLAVDGEVRWLLRAPLVVEYEPRSDESGDWISGPVKLKPGGTTRCRGRISSSVSITGRVLDLDSNPRKGIRVICLSLPGEPSARLLGTRAVAELNRRGEPRILHHAITRDGGRFELGPFNVAPVRLEALLQESPASVHLLSEVVRPDAPGPFDAGDLRPSDHRVEIQLRAIDAAGRDVTRDATPPEPRSIELMLDQCAFEFAELSAPMGGVLSLSGFDKTGGRITVPREPPPSCCAPGWMIVWNRESAPHCSLATEGATFLDIPVVRAAQLEFSAPAIHRSGVPDQQGVVILKVSLAPEDGAVPIEFDMYALCGVSFTNRHRVPPGRYHLHAACEEEGSLWTADQDVLVRDEPTNSVAIDLVQAR